VWCAEETYVVPSSTRVRAGAGVGGDDGEWPVCAGKKVGIGDARPSSSYDASSMTSEDRACTGGDRPLDPELDPELGLRLVSVVNEPSRIANERRGEDDASGKSGWRSKSERRSKASEPCSASA
jgi:hypothetical protein